MTPIALLTDLISQSGITDATFQKTTETKAFTTKFKPEIDRLIASCLLGHRTHKENRAYFDLGKATERRKTYKQFGTRNCFDHFNAKLGIFIEQIGHKQGSHNKAWCFADSFKRSINALLLVASNLKLSNFHRAAITIPKHDTVSFIEPNYLAMKAFFQDQTRLPQERLIMWAYLMSFQLQNGKIPQYYRKGNNNGLYYPVGALSITNLRRELRNTIMSNYIQYDLGAAAFAILYNLSQKKQHYPTLNSFINDPVAYRQSVATYTGLNYQEVKLCFISVAFGGVLSGYGKIANEVDTTKLAQFRSNSSFIEFKTELTTLRKEICSLYPKITSQVQQQFPKRYRTKASARVYQSYMNNIVKAIADLSSDPTNCLYVYDAVFLKDDLDLQCIEKHILQTTGFAVRVAK